MNRDIRDEFLEFFWDFFVDKRFIFFFKKDSRRGLLRFGFVAFLNQNFILISKTTCPRDRVAFAPCPVSR
jgi:hypothetical protein